MSSSRQEEHLLVTAPQRVGLNLTLGQAAALAVEHGWGINIGGGQHHAYWEDASDGGWCLYRRGLH
jgi:acetoin utilization deacetylase AcuC-like enzyme